MNRKINKQANQTNVSPQSFDFIRTKGMATESFEMKFANYASVRTVSIRATAINEFSLFIPITETGQHNTKMQYRSDTGWRCPVIFNDSFTLHIDISPHRTETIPVVSCSTRCLGSR